MAKDKFMSTPEEVAIKAKEWIDNQRPLTNEAMVLWIDNKYGASFIKGISRTNYTARVIVRTEEGEKEIVVSLPRTQHSQ